MKAVAAMVTNGNVLADVGTDHGYVPIMLVHRGFIPSAIAMDVNEGPLQRARENIIANQLQEKIDTRLSDGVSALSDGEVESIVIAGMGGELTIRILTEGESVCRSVKELILQPQSELYEVRTFLWENGYQLLQEDMVKEDGKYYPMMKVKPTGEHPAGQKPSEAELYFGKMLLACKHPVLGEYLLREENTQRQVLEQLTAAQPTEAIHERIKQVKAYLQIIEDCKYETKGLNT